VSVFKHLKQYISAFFRRGRLERIAEKDGLAAQGNTARRKEHHAPLSYQSDSISENTRPTIDTRRPQQAKALDPLSDAAHRGGNIGARSMLGRKSSMGDHASPRPLFILGLPKSGTTFLTHSLLACGAARSYKNVHKEIHLFSSGRAEPSANTFFAHFESNSRAEWACDATPTYIFDPSAIERIHATFETAPLFIICLRERIEQIFSWYVHFTLNSLVPDFWAKTDFTEIQEPDLFGPLPNYRSMFARSAPGIRRCIELFGRERILTFNHHQDYSAESDFWSILSDRIGGPCPPHPTVKWHQDFLPEAIYFEAETERLIDGRLYRFARGDLLIVAGLFSKLYRGVSPVRGHAVMEGCAKMMTSLEDGTISVIKSIIYEDFLESLDLLDVSREQIPLPSRRTLKRARLAQTALDDVPSRPFHWGEDQDVP